MTIPLPKGITQVKWNNKDGTEHHKYRVKVSRKLVKYDKLFTTLEEAKEYLLLTKTNKGKNLIDEEEQERKRLKQIDYEFFNEPTFSYFVKAFIKDYVDILPETTYNEKRKKSNIKTFYKIIENTKIEYEELPLNHLFSQFMSKTDITFGKLKIKHITPFEINSYIKSRLSLGIKKSSVSREITFISKLFSKLKYLDKTLVNLSNPALNYDKDLLKDKTTKYEYRLTKEDQERLFKELTEYSNKEPFYIVSIALLTAMRRSEILTLTRQQITNDYILLPTTKTNPRKVYLTKQAKDLINEYLKLIPETQQNLFTYKIGGFENIFQTIRERANVKIKFSYLRKEAISQMLDNLNFSSSIVATTFMGFSNVKNFEQKHFTQSNLNTQQSILKTIGHSSPQVTKNFYYSINTIRKDNQ